jgi:integrase
MFARGLCLDCYNFVAPRYERHPGECGACRRLQPLKDGYCRLCWTQAREDRQAAPDPRSQQVIAPHLPNVRHHQLFFAGMHPKRLPKPPTVERRRGVKGRPPKAAPPAVAAPRVAWVQLSMLDDNDIRRTYRRGRVDLRREALPDNPWLAWALRLAHTHAEGRGWDPQVRRSMQRALVLLLADHQAGDRLRVSDFGRTVVGLNANLDHVIEILNEMAVADDDRPAPLELWLHRRPGGLAEEVRRDITDWARLLLHGGTRSRPRDPATVRNYVKAAEKALTALSTRCEHLREVTRDDIATYLAALTGRERHTATLALRSLFRWAKRNGLIFRNPTAGVCLPSKAIPLWQPLSPEDVQASVHAADTPQARLCVALAAVHAARPGQIRALRLDDVDLDSRRVAIAGHERPLDELTYRCLREWLDLRRRRWPCTANTHLLVSKESALGHQPVSATWILNLRGLRGTLERLRIDRQLEEAVASGADPLHLAAVFGISDTTAVRYAVNARALLDGHHAAPPSSS